MRAYDVHGTAHQRLSGTVIQYDGKPYYAQTSVNDPGAPEKFNLYKLGGNQIAFRSIDYTDDKFQCPFPQLGWCNIEGDCHYVSRIPTRQTKHGLCSSNMRVGLSSNSEVKPKSGYLVQTKYLHDLITGKYPTQQHAIAKMLEGATGCAFHRNFAFVRVSGTVCLYFHETLMGTVDARNPGEKVISLVDGPAASIYVQQYKHNKFPLKMDKDFT